MEAPLDPPVRRLVNQLAAHAAARVEEGAVALGVVGQPVLRAGDVLEAGAGAGERRTAGGAAEAGRVIGAPLRLQRGVEAGEGAAAAGAAREAEGVGTRGEGAAQGAEEAGEAAA